MTTTTLRSTLAGLTVEHLGTVADQHDLAAFRSALARAWPTTNPDAEIDADEATVIGERVLTDSPDLSGGRVGHDISGRTWVQVAAARRAGLR